MDLEIAYLLFKGATMDAWVRGKLFFIVGCYSVTLEAFLEGALKERKIPDSYDWEPRTHTPNWWEWVK